MNFQFFNACADPWLSAMARATWQGALSLTMAWLLCRAFPRIPPAWQCWIWRLVCLKFLVALFWVTPIDLPVLRPSVPSRTPAPLATDFLPEGATRSLPSPLTPSHEKSSPGKTGLTLAGWVFLAWLAGVAFCGLRLIRSHRMTVSLRRACQPLADTNLVARCPQLSRPMGFGQPPSIRVSPLLFSPLVTGMFRPVIILPSHVLADPARLDLMLAHELAHLERRDLWWAWLPAILKSLFFFHPLVWLADKEWRLAQELACDELAMRRANAPAVEYAEMLLALAAHPTSALKKQPIPFSAPIVETKHSLIRRIRAMKHITGYSRKTSMLAAALVLVFGLGTIAPWRLVAKAANQPAGGLEPDAPATSQRTGLASGEREELLRELDAARAKIAALESRLFGLQARENTQSNTKPDKIPIPGDLSNLDPLIAIGVRRAELRAAELGVQNAGAEFNRKQELVKGALIPAEEVAKAELELAKAQVELERARAQMNVAAAIARAGQDAALIGRVVRVPAPISNQELKKARQLELLREEIKLMDHEVSHLHKQLESGRGSAEDLRTAQRELFGLKRELVVRESRPAEIRSLMEEEIKVIEQQLKEFQKMIEVGVLQRGGDLSWKRELLKLKRELEALD